MTPKVIPRPGYAARAAGSALLLFVVAPTVAGPLPEPRLQASATLSAPLALPDGERELLRAEYHAARSAQAEADIVAEIVRRTRRMEGMVTDIHGMISAWPAPAAPSAPASGTPPRAAAPAGYIADVTPFELYGMIALAAALTFLAWLLKERHAFLKARRRREAARAPQRQQAAPPSAAVVTEPATSAATPLPPSARAGPAAAAAIAPPAASPPLPAATPASLDFDFGDAAADGDQTLELADVMLSLGLTQGAAHTLSAQVHGHPKQALFHWLKLLDIYRRSNMRGDFEQAARDMHMVFNVQPPGWDATGSAISIEDYPHLAAKLQSLWPGAECAEFLAQLLKDNRGGTRIGFPQSVAEEILLLQHLLTAEEPAPASA